MKNFKTFCQAQTAIRSVAQLLSTPFPRKQKLPKSLEQKFSYEELQEQTKICFPSASRIQFLGV